MIYIVVTSVLVVKFVLVGSPQSTQLCDTENMSGAANQNSLKGDERGNTVAGKDVKGIQDVLDVLVCARDCKGLEVGLQLLHFSPTDNREVFCIRYAIATTVLATFSNATLTSSLSRCAPSLDS
jgi:hypothetical protein